MYMTSVKVKFRPSSDTQKEGSVYYQIIHRRKVRHIRTTYKIFPNEWDSALGMINIFSENINNRRSYLNELKKLIDIDILKITKCVSWLEQAFSDYEIDSIIKLYSSTECYTMFLLYGKELLVEMKGVGKNRTVETYQSALNSFERFLNNRADVPLNNFDSKLMVEYEIWLKSNGICPNTISYYMRNLRAIYNRAVEQGLTTQQYPFKNVYTGIEKTKKRAVPLEVIRKIRDMELKKKSLAFARDVFLFSFYMRGMSFVDMAFLKKKDLQNGVLVYRRNKTGQQLWIKWESPMQKLIEKYDTSDSPYLLPIIRNPKVDEWRQYRNEAHRVNRNLKKIGEEIGLNIPLTTYVARHAWASIAKSKNIPLSVISEALGHDSEKTTKIYLASLDTSVVDKANNIIIMSI